MVRSNFEPVFSEKQQKDDQGHAADRPIDVEEYIVRRGCLAKEGVLQENEADRTDPSVREQKTVQLSCSLAVDLLEHIGHQSEMTSLTEAHDADPDSICDLVFHSESDGEICDDLQDQQ